MNEPRTSIGTQLDTLDDRRDLARYRWLKYHFRFQEDSQYEIWFDESLKIDGYDKAHNESLLLDKAIDRCMSGYRNG